MNRKLIIGGGVVAVLAGGYAYWNISSQPAVTVEQRDDIEIPP